MSEPIKPGDLVVLVRSGNNNEGALGTVRAFSGNSPVTFNEELWYGRELAGKPCWLVEWSRPLPAILGGTYAEGPVPAEWIKRIRDFPELADERHDEEITA